MRKLKSKKKLIKPFDLINNTILLLVAILCVYPFLYIFFVACSDGTFLSRGEVTFLPKGFNLEAFKYIFANKKLNVLTGLKNSFIYTLFGTICSVVFTYFTAYALSRKRVKGGNLIMSLFVITWVFEAGIIPQYIIYSNFGFIDNPLVMIIPGAINTQFLIICKTYLEGLPQELEEAAFMDGANDFVILRKIFFPLSKPIVATVAMFYAVSIWNQYLNPQIYLKSENLKTIQQVLKQVVITEGTAGTTFKNTVQNGITLNQQNLKAAAVFVAMVPIVCVYPFVQKYFKKGILIGSVKG